MMMPNYKIAAFQDESSERFEAFYDASESLKYSILLADNWSNNGLSSEFLRALVGHIQKNVPAGPFVHEVTEKYVRGMENIAHACTNLADLLEIDESLGLSDHDRKLDEGTQAVQDQVVDLCKESDKLLKDHFYLVEKPARAQSDSTGLNDDEKQARSRPPH